MSKEIKYLTDEEVKAGKAGYRLTPFIIETIIKIESVVLNGPDLQCVDMSEIDYLDTPTQAPG